MASKALLITILIAAAVAPALATNYMVDWTLTFNSTQWLAGKQFHVGDNIMFMYTPGDHNVISVSGADFKACNSSAPLKGPFTSGNDTLALNAVGKRWYICGFPSHCSQGMKLVIDVTAEGPAPAPAPTSASAHLTPFKLMLAAVTAAFWMLVL